jgi:hypothetical protein
MLSRLWLTPAVIAVLGLIIPACEADDLDDEIVDGTRTIAMADDDDSRAEEPTPEPTGTPQPEPTATPVPKQAVSEDEYLTFVSGIVDRYIEVDEILSRIDTEYQEGTPEHEAAAQEQVAELASICDDLTNTEPPAEFEHHHFNLETGFCRASEAMGLVMTAVYDDTEVDDEFITSHRNELVTAGSFIHSGLMGIDDQHATDFAERSGIERPSS